MLERPESSGAEATTYAIRRWSLQSVVTPFWGHVGLRGPPVAEVTGAARQLVGYLTLWIRKHMQRVSYATLRQGDMVAGNGGQAFPIADVAFGSSC